LLELDDVTVAEERLFATRLTAFALVPTFPLALLTIVSTVIPAGEYAASGVLRPPIAMLVTIVVPMVEDANFTTIQPISG
jgi:hypothetical protein